MVGGLLGEVFGIRAALLITGIATLAAFPIMLRSPLASIRVLG